MVQLTPRAPPAGSARAVRELAASPGSCWTVALGLLLVAGTSVAGPTSAGPGDPERGADQEPALRRGRRPGRVHRASSPHRGGLYTRVMSHRVLRHLGHISYGVFLHPHVRAALRHVVDRLRRSSTATCLQIFALTLVLSLAAAELLYRLVERPAMRLRNLGSGSTPATTTAETVEHHQVVRPGQRSGPAGDRSPRPDEVRRGRDQRQRADQPREHLVLAPPGDRAPAAATTKQPAPTQPPSSPAPRRPAPSSTTGRMGAGPIGAQVCPRPAPGRNQRKGQQQDEQARPDSQAEPVSAIRRERGAHRLCTPVDDPPLLPAVDDDRRQGVAPLGGLPPGVGVLAQWRGTAIPPRARSAARPHRHSTLRSSRRASSPMLLPRSTDPGTATALPRTLIVFSPARRAHRCVPARLGGHGEHREDGGRTRQESASHGDAVDDHRRPGATSPTADVVGQRDRREGEPPQPDLADADRQL